MRSGLVLAWMCGVSLSTFGCGSRQNQTISLGNADAGRTLAAAVGDQIEVTLQTIGPGQYGDSPEGPSVPALSVTLQVS